MKSFAFRWGVLAFTLSCFLLFSRSMSSPDRKVRGVNLGGWLVVEGWMTPELSYDIINKDLLDGTQFRLRSVALNTYVTAENAGWSSDVSVNRTIPQEWETFKLWRVSDTQFQFRSYGNQFLSCNGQGSPVTAKGVLPSPTSPTETFQIEINVPVSKPKRIHIKLQDGSYLQAVKSSNQLIAIKGEAPGWEDNAATFEMELIEKDVLGGEYQIANGFAPDWAKAKQVFETHRSTFVTEQDFEFLSQNGINTVRIPVGWWIYKDPNPPFPFVGGSLAALDNAFDWAAKFDMKCIIDLHAAPGSQNQWDHSANRDGTIEWPEQKNIDESLEVIRFLAMRYGDRTALLGIELLNEPVPKVELPDLVSYYRQGYDIVRQYAKQAYVIICPRVGMNDEIFQTGINPSFLVVDLHLYNYFEFVETSTQENIDKIYKDKQKTVRNANAVNGPLVFIGEWANAMYLNDGNTRPDSDYIEFGKAQLNVYEQASFGWAYWSMRVRNPAKNNWSLMWNIKRNIIRLGDLPKK